MTRREAIRQWRARKLAGRVEHLRGSHACNAYCSDGTHCDLIYTTIAPEGFWSAVRLYGAELRVQLVRAELAREAPPMEAIPLDNRQVVVGHEMRGDTRILVWWRLPDDGYIPETTAEIRALAAAEGGEG